MNKIIRRIVCILSIALFFAGCTGDSYYVFNQQDLSWMAYDTVIHPATFIDQSGQQFEVTLLQRKFSHDVIYSSGKRTSYSADAIAEIMVDTICASIVMTKRRSHYFQQILECTLKSGDLEVHYFSQGGYDMFYDSVQVNTIWYRNVYSCERDTADPNFNSQCWKFLFNKEKGFLEMDFRGGKFYKIQ